MSNKVQYSIELVDQISAKLKTINNSLDENEAKVSKSGRSMKSMGDEVSSLVKKYTAMIASYTMLKKAIGETFTAISNFSGASARLRAIVQPTTAEFQSLEKAALKLGSTTAFTASQVMDAFTEQAKLGQKVNEILASGNDVLSLAAMAQISLSEAAEMTVQTLNQFDMSADETTRIVDVMAKSFTSSALDARKFGEAMKYAGTIGAESGEDIESVSAILSVLADRAIDASMAGTSTRRVLLELADANSKASKTLKDHGSTATTVEEKLSDLNKMNLSLTDTTDMFGIIASTAAKVLIENADSVSELSKEYDKANGSAKKMADTMLDSIPGAIVIMKSAIEGLFLTFKNKLEPAMRATIDEITSLANAWTFLLSKQDRKAQEDKNNAIIAEIQELKKLRTEYEQIRDTQLALKSMGGSLFSKETLQDALENIKTINTEIKSVSGVFLGETGGTVSKPTPKTKKPVAASLPDQDTIDKYKKLSQEMMQISQQTALMQEDGRAKELMALDQWYTSQLEKFKGHNDLLEQLDIEHNQRMGLILYDYNQQELEQEREMVEKKKAWMDELAEKNKQTLEKRKQDELEFNKAMKGAAFDVAMVTADTIFSISKQSSDRKFRLQKEEIKNSKKTEEEKAKLIAEIEKQEFEKGKRMSLLQAIINGALGITKTIATMGMTPATIPFLVLQGAMTAAQIAVIASQKFAKGGIVQKEPGKSITGDQHLIRANPGEMVLTREQQKGLGQTVILGDTNIVINGNASPEIVSQINQTIQERNEDLRKSLLSLQESGRIGGLKF